MDNATEKFEYNRSLFEEFRRNAIQAQVDYGKWLLASLLLIHGGSIFAIAQLGKDGVKLFSAAGPWFVAGIMLALLAGMCTWFNFSYAIAAYQAGWAAVVNRTDPQTVLATHIKKIKWSMRLAISFAFSSALMIVAGAWQIFGVIKMEKTWWGKVVEIVIAPLNGG